jgi:hypothetical protein
MNNHCFGLLQVLKLLILSQAHQLSHRVHDIDLHQLSAQNVNEVSNDKQAVQTR